MLQDKERMWMKGDKMTGGKLNTMSVIKMLSTSRFIRKSPSLHRSSGGGGCKKATSTGVTVAVKQRAKVVTMSQYAIQTDFRGSITHARRPMRVILQKEELGAGSAIMVDHRSSML